MNLIMFIRFIRYDGDIVLHLIYYLWNTILTNIIIIIDLFLFPINLIVDLIIFIWFMDYVDDMVFHLIYYLWHTILNTNCWIFPDLIMIVICDHWLIHLDYFNRVDHFFDHVQMVLNERLLSLWVLKLYCDLQTGSKAFFFFLICKLVPKLDKKISLLLLKPYFCLKHTMKLTCDTHDQHLQG